MGDQQKCIEIDKRNYDTYLSVFRNEQFDEALNVFLEETLQMSKSIRYRNGRYFSIALLAVNGIGLGNYRRAYNFLEQLDIEIIENESDALVQMLYYNAYLIYNYEHVRDFRTALEYCNKELKAAEDYNNTYDIMRVRLNLAAINGELGNHKIAEHMYREVIEYGESINESPLLPYCYVNLAEGLYEVGKYNEALIEYNKAYEIVKDSDAATLEHIIYYHMARVYNRLNDFESAFTMLNKAKELENENHKTGEMFNRLHEQVVTSLALGRTNEILEEVIEWESNLKDTESSEIMVRFCLDKSKIYAALHQYEHAYIALNNYINHIEKKDQRQIDEELSESIHDAYKQELDRLDALASVGRQLTMLSDIDEMILKLKEEFEAILPADFIGISLIKGNELEFSNYFNEDRKVEPKSTSLDSEVSLAVWSIRHDEPVVINDLKKDFPKYINRIGVFKDSKDEKIKSVLIAPLKVGGKVIGVFTIQSYKSNAYSSVEVKIHKIITDYLAVAVSNAQQTEVLKKLTIQDNLTKISNRRGFTEFFDHRVLELENENASMSIIMLDLDYFKNVNDTYGHVVGDEVLCAVADILKRKENSNILAARLGGEEFALLVCDRTYDDVMILAETIRSDIEALIVKDKKGEVKVTTSIGVSYQKSGSKVSYDELYYDADKALYLAKGKGRNRVVVT